MFEITVGGKNYQVERKGDELFVNGQKQHPDVVRIDQNRMHLLLDGQGFRIEMTANENQQMSLSINNQQLDLTVRNELEQMLSKLGLDQLAEQKVNELKAPMPGLVLRIMAEEGTEVQKGDPILVLESMKMENVLKSPGQGIVDKILIKTGQAVEKGQIMLIFR